MSRTREQPWLLTFRPRAEAKLRLFCFPHAGVGASIFRAWASTLPPDIEVCAIQYPGREHRAGEPCATDVPALVQPLSAGMLPALDRPFAFFGHSMGALVAFELTRQLHADQGPRPEHVFFSAAGAPHIPEPRPIHHLPGQQFLDEVVRLGGMPAEVLSRPDLLEYALPILRADFAACERYRYQIGAPLQCPISVCGGERDPRVERARLQAWSAHASVHFSLEMFPGDHFFLRTEQAALLRTITRELRPLLGGI